MKSGYGKFLVLGGTMTIPAILRLFYVHPYEPIHLIDLGDGSWEWFEPFALSCSPESTYFRSFHNIFACYSAIMLFGSFKLMLRDD